MTVALLIVAGAYLIGSVSFAVVVSRAFGLPDPHEYGSGNPGATNVLRTGNKKAAILTLAGDGLKGYIAVALAQWLLPHAGGLPGSCRRPHWPCSSATSSPCSTASRAARVWPPLRASCSHCIGRSVSRCWSCGRRWPSASRSPHLRR